MKNAKGYMVERKKNILAHIETIKFEKKKMQAEVDKFSKMEEDCKAELVHLENALDDFKPKPATPINEYEGPAE